MRYINNPFVQSPSDRFKHPVHVLAGHEHVHQVDGPFRRRIKDVDHARRSFLLQKRKESFLQRDRVPQDIVGVVAARKGQQQTVFIDAVLRI